MPPLIPPPLSSAVGLTEGTVLTLNSPQVLLARKVSNNKNETLRINKSLGMDKVKMWPDWICRNKITLEVITNYSIRIKRHYKLLQLLLRVISTNCD